MKKLLTVCMMLAALSMIAFAGTFEKSPELGNALAKYEAGKDLTPAEKAIIAEYEESRFEESNGLDLNGGVDGYGYMYVDNQAPDTVVYEWIELCGDPGATDFVLESGTLDDGFDLAVPIGFSFPYYGATYTTCEIGTNGVIHLGTSATRPSYTNGCINAASRLTIYPYWDDLNLSAAGTLGCSGAPGAGAVRYKTDGTNFIVEWKRVDPYSGTGMSTFQCILRDNGQIKVNFINDALQHSALSTGATVGIEHTSATYGVQYSCNTAGIVAGRSVVFFLPPSIGRCCYLDVAGAAQCADLSLNDCAAYGGQWAGPNTSCASTPCPVGRCCYTVNGDICDQGCLDNKTQLECAAIGGTWTEGLDCSTPCPLDCYCTCSSGANTHCALGPVAITDNNCPLTPSDLVINVPVEYHITDVNICFDITHTWDADMSIFLISPLGTVVELSSGNGGSGDNYHCTILDDESAGGSVTAGLAPFSGSYVPEFPLAGFDGENALGNWTLQVCDGAGGDVGTINWACLSFEYDYILPVEFGNFDAVAGNNMITLNWSTASESNMSHFEVLRGADKIAEVTCTNSATTQNYSYVDNDVTNGVAYSYTLIAVGIDGTRGELATVNASPNANGAVVTEYALLQNFPNPFNPETNIAFDMVEAGHVTVSVFNVVGQKVAELVNGNMNAGRHIVSFDASNLPSGLYLYKMEANGFSDQKKMVLMK